MKKIIGLFFIFLLFTTINIYSQNDTTKNYFTKTVTVTAGMHYERSGLTEIFLGEHWRRLWTTPFKAGVLDLNKFAGGLTPYKRGGGLQTKSLRLKGNDGKTYKFRSIDKDPRRILPPDLQETIFADAFQDQISTSHPLSALIVAPLLNKVGILNVEPIVVVMPNDVKLGEYRKDFGNVLGTFEENPDEGSDGEKGFAEADKILNSEKLYKKLEKDNDNQIDEIEFLKARLMDLMIGDWDRHSDQWLWAGYKKNGKMIYEPIPRDRDQAFCLYDGLLPFIVGESITQIEGYGKNYPKIYDLSFNGRYLDRRFLPGVRKEVYDSLTELIQSKITDKVIIDAVRKMPEEWYKLEGKNLVSMIKSRRNKLKEASDEFYDLINETADVYASDKSEHVSINTFEGGVHLTVGSKKDYGEGMNENYKPFFDRVFYSDETDEIRIYTNGGNDEIVVNGSKDSKKNYEFPNTGIDIKIINGNGKKSIKDFSGEDILDVYNDIRPKKDMKERYEPAIEDRGYDWRFGPVLNYNSDDGLILGGGPILYKFGFRAVPYVYRMSLLASYATTAKSYAIKYTGEFYSIIKGIKIFLDIQKTQLAITRFFGEGNETSLDENLNTSGFYKVRQELLLINPLFEIPISQKIKFTVAPFYKYSDVIFDENTLLGQNPSTYGIGGIKFLGGKSTLTLDTRDNETEPFKGIYAQIIGNYTPNIFENNFGYSKAGFDIRGYISTDTVKGLTLALRGAGGKVWGTYPFYESMFLGGINSLKGFSRERFAGDAAVVGQAELRLRVGRVNILIPGMFGLSVFGGAGRVFLEESDSKRWHNSYGGTAWITYLDRLINIGFTVAKSDEGFKFFFGSALFL